MADKDMWNKKGIAPEDAMANATKKAEKASDITEDDLKIMLDDIQKLTDDYIKEIDETLNKKEDELMNI